MIGLDGGSPELVRRFVEAGDLPNLASIAERGGLGTLLSTVNAMSPAAWSSFVTGLDPGNHGIFYFLDRIPGTYQARYVTAQTRDGTPIWSTLSASGRRVASLFVPLTYPAVEVNGILVSGWLAPSMDDPAYACPRDLPRRMLEAAPEFELHTGMTEFVRPGRYAEALERKQRSLCAKARIAAHVLGSEKWDLFTVVFDETDPIQHYFWHFLDSDHPEYTPEGNAKYGDAIRAIYRTADEAVGRLLELVGDDTFVFVISDHGYGVNQRAHLYLKGLLQAHGLQAEAGRGLIGSAARGAYRVLSRALPSGVKHRLAGRFRGLHERMEHTSFAGDIDWSATRAYSFWSSGCSEPWINARGRDPEGTVDPDDDYDSTVEQVCEVILSATDPATGETVADGVLRKDEIYSGPHLGRAPDLLVNWRSDIVVNGLQASTGAIVDTPVAEDLRTGSHRREGLLVACGPKDQLGQLPERASIADLAPTIYGLLEVPPPHPLDGRPWTELFPHAIHALEPARDSITSAEDGADADIAAIKQRLEDLGYL